MMAKEWKQRVDRSVIPDILQCFRLKERVQYIMRQKS